MKANGMIILGAAVAAVYIMTRATAKPAAKGSGALANYSNNVLSPSPGLAVGSSQWLPYSSNGTLIADKPKSFMSSYGNAVDNFFNNGFAV